MKTILLPFYDDDAAEAALDVGAQLAARFGGYIEGLFVMRPPQIIDGEGIVLADSYLTQLKEEGRRLGDRARTRFDDCVARRGMTAGSLTEPPEGMVIGWREIEGLEGQVIGDYGRVFDLVVIGREFGHPWVDWHVMAEAALFESGRPIILAPEQPGTGLGENVVIAWNNSTETARTVAFAMPLLASASVVTIIGVEGWGRTRTSFANISCATASPPAHAPSNPAAAHPERWCWRSAPRSVRICWSRARIPRAGCGSSSSAAPPDTS